jgi:hypothetical protein
VGGSNDGNPKMNRKGRAGWDGDGALAIDVRDSGSICLRMLEAVYSILLLISQEETTFQSATSIGTAALAPTLCKHCVGRSSDAPSKWALKDILNIIELLHINIIELLHRKHHCIHLKTIHDTTPYFFAHFHPALEQVILFLDGIIEMVLPIPILSTTLRV